MKGSSVFKICLLALAVIFVIHLSISSVYKPIKSETAVYYTVTDGFKITGLIIRDEIIVTSDTSGVLHFALSDGDRVAKNGVIANIYESEAASITVTELEDIESKISDLEDILSYNDIEAANLDIINEKVDSCLQDFRNATSAGDYTQASEYTNKLLSAINRKSAALGTTESFESQLVELKKKRDELSANQPKAKGKVTAHSGSGYFVSKTDGYETVLTTDNLAELTPEFLADAKQEQAQSNAIGKIVSDYEWYIAADVSVSDSLKYKEGEELKIATSVKSSPTLSAAVKKINISEDSDRAVIIFACSDMNEELASMRSGPMTVIKAEYSGLKIPRQALRVVDSVRGVYVVNGMQLSFVPVNIIYTADEFYICEKQTDSDGVLKLYDSVVVKGKNLYDGKIIS